MPAESIYLFGGAIRRVRPIMIDTDLLIEMIYRDL